MDLAGEVVVRWDRLVGEAVRRMEVVEVEHRKVVVGRIPSN
jgi:hypothetical protein